MSPQDFCYWLQGFLEMGDPKDLNEAQVKMLKSHLNLVFVNVTGTTPPAVEEPKKEILTDAAKDKLREDIITGIQRRDWNPIRETTWCSAGSISGLSGHGARIC